MDEKKAREILGEWIGEDNCLTGMPGGWEPLDSGDNVLLDGSFSADELEALAWWMRNKKGVATK